MFYRRVGASTLEHDHWIAGLTRQAGAEGWTLRPGETNEGLGARILGDLMASGKAFLILGGLLMPLDTKEWTPDVARRTAAHLARLDDPEEKKVANQELLSVVLEFFVSGLAFWMTSETSGKTREKDGEPGPSGATETLENGRDSFGGSAEVITSERAEPIESGRFEKR